MNKVYLLLGSNLAKERNLLAGFNLLCQRTTVLAASSVYETAPVGDLAMGQFFNAAVLIETGLAASELKEDVLIPLELALKADRSQKGKGKRTFDVDIILFNNEVFDYLNRHVPDPDLLNYPHAIVPIAEISPELPHPETGEAMAMIAKRVVGENTPGYDGPAPVWVRDDIELIVPVAFVGSVGGDNEVLEGELPTS